MNDAFSHMKMQIEEKERASSERKHNYNERVKESLAEDKQYRDLQNRLKSEKLQFQDDYANVLRKQMQSKSNNTMISLQNSKLQRDSEKTEGAPTHMIPGIYNLASVGTRPIYRTGVMIANSPPIPSAKAYEHHNKSANVLQSYRYNPITNQIPMLTSNPYILKEMQRYKKEPNNYK